MFLFRISFILFFVAASLWAEPIRLSDEEALRIGKKIWKNECAGTIDGLTSWNEGEEFASLGIGHFIWFPKGIQVPFEESFPKLIRFLEGRKVVFPDWLRGDCPWNTREEFEKDFQSERMCALRKFLRETIALQARFAADRLQKALPKMLETLPEPQRKGVEKQFYRVANSPDGFYVLMDYVNFKGEGTNPRERYKGKGWGLLQVLQQMKGSESGPVALREFADSAVRALSERIKNSPPARGEVRWLPGWKNRLKTYLP